MFKRAIVTTLFLLLTTGVFGVLDTKANAQGCRTKEDWPGTCTMSRASCVGATTDPGVAWDPKAEPCKSEHFGCCGTSPVVGASCRTKEDWPGTCILFTHSCDNVLNAGVSWDPKAAPCNTLTLYGCCGTSPVVGASCRTKEDWPGTCTIVTSCAPIAGIAASISWDPKAAPCNTLTLYGCCGTNPAVEALLATKNCDFAGTQKQTCYDCMHDGKHAWTALGCIPTDPSQFISQLLGIGVGIAGGIAFLLILIGGFQVLTSAGNPEHLNAGKELITSAITGLLIIIFSLFILRLIGFTIFAIPGFR